MGDCYRSRRRRRQWSNSQCVYLGRVYALGVDVIGYRAGLSVGGQVVVVVNVRVFVDE